MKSKLILIVIVLLGFLLRTLNVTSAPAILNRDEAALAYNALLLKETGKDEWGVKWPLTLESFGDYKLVGYPLLLIPTFSLMGYTDLAVKFPSILGGTLLILMAFYFAKDICRTNVSLALLAGFFVAIQPVFFFYSRIAFEANVALLLFVTAWWLLLKEQKKNVFWENALSDGVAILFLLVAVFTYNTPLLLLPFFLPVLIWWRGWKSWRNWVVPFIGIGIVLGIGGASLLSLSKQKSGITIFSDETVWQQSVVYHQQFSGVAQKILGNRIVFFGKIIVGNYVNTFSPVFLVIKGGAHPWHELPGFGHFYWTVYVLAMFGIGSALWSVIRSLQKRGKWSAEIKRNVLFLYLLLISVLPAAVTVDAPHATRSLFFFFLLILFAVMSLAKIKTKKIFFIVIFVLVIVESLNYFTQYFTQYPRESTSILQGGFDTKIRSVEDTAENKKVAIIDHDGFQYILAAWYLKMPPATFYSTIEKHLPDRIGFRYGYKLGHYRFIVSPNDRFSDESEVVSWQNDKWIVEEK